MSSPASSDRISPQLIGAITATAILAFLGLFLETVLNVLFPALMSDFSVTMADVQWMTSGYLLVVSIVMPITGWLQRRFTPRSLFLTAAGSILTGALIAALAPTYPVLLAGRLVQGMGTGIVTPLMFTIILTRSPRSKIGALMGVGALVLGTAPALGPILGGIIGTVASWRTVFWIYAALVLVSVCVGSASITGGQVSRVSLDIVQVALIALTFVGLVLGVERAGTALAEGASLLMSLGLIVLGVAGAVLFVLRSHSAPTPVIRLAVLRAPAYRYSLLAFAFFQFAALGLGYLLPNAAQLALGSSAMSAGLLVRARRGPWLLSDGDQRRLSPSTASARAPRSSSVRDNPGVLHCLAARGTSLSTGWMATFYFVFMLGFGMAYANTQTHAMAHVDGPLTADGTALMNTVQQFFGAIAMTILATIVSMTQAGLTSANPGFAPATARGVFIGFIVVAVIVAAALGLELVAMRHSRITSGTQAITAEEIIEADEIEAAVLAEMGDSAQVSGR